MQYEVGDTIKIREDLVTAGENGDFDGRCGYNDDMAEFAGRILTVTSVDTRRGYTIYTVIEDKGIWSWTTDMLDPAFAEGSMYVPKEEKNMVHEAVERIDLDDVKAKIYETLELCEIYHPTDKGIDAVLDNWKEKKGRADVWNGNSVLDVLSKHPDYVPEKGYIVKKNEYDRGVDSKVIVDVLSQIEYATHYPTSYILKPVEIRPWSYMECSNIVDRMERISQGLAADPSNMRYRGMTYEEVVAEKQTWIKRMNILSEEYHIMDGNCYTFEDIDKMDKLTHLISKIKNKISEQITDMTEDGLKQPLLISVEIFNMIENSGLEIRGIRVGQKFNKVIGKILTETGVKDNWSDYNKEFARLCDAASPTKFTRFTIISANPVDYYRMSFGSSWSSCQTIDKLGKYRPSSGGDSYEGMHASGTSSYQGDESSIIMYTVDKSYEGSDYEMQPKINRCMFHLGKGKFVMGRVYPQGTDGEEEVYRQWRNIFQQIIAECMGLPNYWKTLKDLGEKEDQIRSEGTHYRDYLYDYCNIAGWSYIKPTAETTPSNKYIKIGSQPICPQCGETHWEDDNIECSSCRSYFEHECACCGATMDREDMHEIDGEWYCEDCCFYCEYHQEWEHEDSYYVHSYGDICEYALYESGDFATCEYCGDHYYIGNGDDGITTEDGYWFCDSSCAENAGYVLCDDDCWYRESETHYCDVCGSRVHDRDWDDELEMCDRCAEERVDDVEEEGIA